MGESRERKSYKAFQECLSKVAIKRDRWRIKYSKTSVIYDYWESISFAEKKRIISSKSWNHYPTEKWECTGEIKKPYGPVLEDMVKHYSLSSAKDRELFVKHSQGLFAVFMFDRATSKEKLIMAKRLIKTKDKRLKGRAISVLPVNKIWWALSDPDYAARNKAISRIGFENCYKEFLPSPEDISRKRSGIDWFGRKALLLAEYEEVKEHINNITDKTPDWIVSALVSKISEKDILYHLDKQKNGLQSSNIIQSIMGIRER